MFKNYHFLSGKNIFYFLLLAVFCCLFFIFKNNLPFLSVNRIPANVLLNPYALPVGTQMVVPPWIMQQYQSSLQSNIYGNVLDYLIYNYSVSAPNESGESTYYIPLSLSSYDSDDDFDDDYYYDFDDYSPVGKSDIYMVDVTKVQVMSPSPTSTPSPIDPPAAPSLETSSPEQVRFTTTDIIDPVKAPPPPAPDSRPKPDPVAERPPASCEESEVHTEADSPCVECAGLREEEVKPFLNVLEAKVDSSHKGKHFPGVIRDICKNCYGVDVGDFFKYIKDRASEEGVPAEILFALVMRESNGNCKAGGDGGNSVGLFQLNTGNSTCLRGCRDGALEGVSSGEMKSACEKGNYHKDYGSPGYACPGTPSFSNPKICLNNPYCNFEEAFHLLIDQKWGFGNNGERYKSTDKRWAEMEAEERNKWRNAIVSYNGRKYVDPVENLMRESWKKMSTDERKRWAAMFQAGSEMDVSAERIPRPLLNNWEFKRMFFMKRHLTGSGVSEAMITNLAHVESITGREASGEFAKSAICQWVHFASENHNLSCP